MATNENTNSELTAPPTEQITVNIIQLASDLAEAEMVAKYGEEQYDAMEDPEGGYIAPYDDEFNALYDKYETAIRSAAA